ncbi:hypothetical protein BBI17_004156 [Phytophthora kernoviae]|uniref:RxLR effector protein n=1 Tax=Phytophthora kernoviae TaxID=325452 RepID=A0A3R7J9A5_9STRA|nr:hypothetical protein BBI17_004156 [Phytophthora kernoviae]
MRAPVCYILLVVAATFLSDSEAMWKATHSNQVEAPQMTSAGLAQLMGADPSNGQGKRFLRTYKKEELDNSQDGEERALPTLPKGMYSAIGGLYRNKADTKTLLKSYLASQDDAKTVAQKLGMLDSNKQIIFDSLNLDALVKADMKRILRLWLYEGSTVDDVAAALGISALARKQLSLDDPSMRALDLYQKMFTKANSNNGVVYVTINGARYNEFGATRYAYDHLIKKNVPAKDVKKMLRLAKLTPEEAQKAPTWPFWVKYQRMVKDFS